MKRVKAKKIVSKSRDLEWKTLNRKYAFRTPWLRVKKEKVRLPSGRELNDYYSVEGNRLVAIIATRGNNVLLVRQYRHPVRAVTLDFPGGMVEEKETFVRAAQRELFEETGLRVKKMKKLVSYYPDSGKKGDVKVLYYATIQSGLDKLVSHEEGVKPLWISPKKLAGIVKKRTGLESTLLVGIRFLDEIKKHQM